jgi:hypothetical protein
MSHGWLRRRGEAERFEERMHWSRTIVIFCLNAHTFKQKIDDRRNCLHVFVLLPFFFKVRTTCRLGSDLHGWSLYDYRI